uniref:Uncharacterized protein n=1 Tax=Panagrolaimus sp. ES5 TaxID=591445 RepID=A0AC34F8C7_9BILA
MFSTLKGFENQKQLIGFITNEADDAFSFIIVDSKTEKFVTKFVFQAKNAKLFIGELSTFTSKNLFKAFIIDLFEVQMPPPYKHSYEFCEELRETFRHLQIPSYFVSEEYYLFSSLLIAAKTEVKLHETILIILTCKAVIQSSGSITPGVIVGEFKFTPSGFKLVQRKTLCSLNHKEKPAILYQQICGSSNPQKIIVSAGHAKKVAFHKIFKSKNLTIFNGETACYRDGFVVETCKWMLDKSYIKYHILPYCTKGIRIYGYFGSANHIFDIVKINIGDTLPITKSHTFAKSLPQLHIMFGDRRRTFGEKKELPKNCHGYKITLTMDEENFEDIDIYQFMFKNFDNILLRLDALLESKIPFIGFYGNSSVIGIYENSKKYNGYRFMNEWNGPYGIDCYISFDEKKPKFGVQAMDSVITKNTFVVFDLLKIMSMPSDNIKVDKTWAFKFINDSENPILIQFDTFDGTKSAASPAFLMAMFIRQHLKVIEAKNGEKPTKIALLILSKEFCEEELKRINEGLEESCKLLKIDFCFVEHDSLKVGLD